MIPDSVLFITRNYPPKVGGLEKYSYNLIETFASRMTTHRISLSKSNNHLLWFFPYSLLKALFIIDRFSVSHVHLCDAMLGPVGFLLKILTGGTVTATVHGLDITYNHPLYQKIVPRCLERLDRIVCVSRSTRQELLNRTRLPPENCAVIPNGIMPDEMYLPQPKEKLLEKLAALTRLKLKNRKILLTVGRLVKRKGVAWFAAYVMPKLPEEYVYVAAGEGPERGVIEEVIARHHLEERIFLLGEISDEVRNILYNFSDMLVMPNITVLNDVEGFGIVAIEAASCGLPVVAAGIQGIRDAVIDGETGSLIQEKDAPGFLKSIQTMALRKRDVRSVACERFGWEKISTRYQNFIFGDWLS